MRGSLIEETPGRTPRTFSSAAIATIAAAFHVALEDIHCANVPAGFLDDADARGGSDANSALKVFWDLYA
jgi:hypothetical protein